LLPFVLLDVGKLDIYLTYIHPRIARKWIFLKEGK
jgi:hypothetical protein